MFADVLLREKFQSFTFAAQHLWIALPASSLHSKWQCCAQHATWPRGSSCLPGPIPDLLVSFAVVLLPVSVDQAGSDDSLRFSG